MAQIKNPLSGGGGGGSSIDVVNGVIERYFSNQGEIAAQTFIQKFDSNRTVTQIDTTYPTDLYACIKLDENRVFVCWRYGTSYYINAKVFTVNGENISGGTITRLGSGDYSGYYGVRAVKIDTDKVMVLYGTTSNYRLQAMVCTISGTIITAGTLHTISSANGSARSVSVAALGVDKVFVGHANSSSSLYLAGQVLTVSGTTIATSIITILSSNITSAAYGTEAVATDEHHVICWYYGGLCLVNIPSTIDTVVSNISLSDLYPNRGDLILAGGENFIVGHIATDKNVDLRLGVFSTTSISLNNAVIVASNAESGILTLLPISNRVAAVWQKDDSAETFMYTLCTIDGGNLLFDEEKELVAIASSMARQQLESAALTQNLGIVATNQVSGSSFYLSLFAPSSVMRAVTPDNISGITSSQCTETVAGDVWVLDTSSGSE